MKEIAVLSGNCQQPDADPEDWFPQSVAQGRRSARRLCSGCPAIRDCARVALERPSEGIWAGVFITKTDHGEGRKAARETLRTIAGRTGSIR